MKSYKYLLQYKGTVDVSDNADRDEIRQMCEQNVSFNLKD